MDISEIINRINCGCNVHGSSKKVSRLRLYELKYYVEYKALFETWNEVNENKVLSYWEALRFMWNNKKILQYVKFTNPITFKLDFQKVGQHSGSKWLILGTKNRKDNQLQSLELPCIISYWGMWTWHQGVRRKHVQCNIQGECPGTETSRELRICRTRTT